MAIDVLTLIQELRSDYYRASALEPVLQQLDLTHLEWPLWLLILQSFASQVRRHFIGNLPNLAPAINHLGGDAALREVVEAMRDVSRQWP